MRFLGYTLGDPNAPMPEPTPEMYAAMDKLMEEATKAGVLVAAGGLGPADDGIHVIRKDGKFTVVDGPFTESKEVIAGYAVIRVDSKDDAIALASRFASIVGDTEVEIRQIAEWD
jgi:hypothetical protein